MNCAVKIQTKRRKLILKTVPDGNFCNDNGPGPHNVDIEGSDYSIYKILILVF